jgi:hypothetical protein
MSKQRPAAPVAVVEEVTAEDIETALELPFVLRVGALVAASRVRELTPQEAADADAEADASAAQLLVAGTEAEMDAARVEAELDVPHGEAPRNA